MDDVSTSRSESAAHIVEGYGIEAASFGSRMVCAKSFAATAAMFVWLVVGVRPAAAEWFADLYGGRAFTESQQFSLDGRQDGAHVAGLVANVSFDRSFEVGGRFGYWFEALDIFGLGLDVSHFQPNIQSQTAMAKGDITDSRGVLLGVPMSVSGATPVKLKTVDLHVTSVAVDLMLRWPVLLSTEFPHGQLQPYLTAGPAVHVVELQRFETGAAHGVKAGGGLMWQLTKNVGVFGEYRYTHIRPILDAGEIQLRTHLSTHHLLAGLSFRF